MKRECVENSRMFDVLYKGKTLLDMQSERSRGEGGGAEVTNGSCENTHYGYVIIVNIERN